MCDNPQLVIEQLKNTMQQIEIIEKKYPFVVSSIIAIMGLFISIVSSWSEIVEIIPKLQMGNFAKTSVFYGVICFFTISILLIACYILNLFRQVAILRGYAAFLEKHINNLSLDVVYLWNSAFVDKFVSNNLPNVLIMLLSLIIVTVILVILGCLLWNQCNHIFVCLYMVGFMLFSAFLIVGFSRNDLIRKRSFNKAVKENYKSFVVCYYTQFKNLIKKSGVGSAAQMQQEAMRINGYIYTEDLNDDYDILHINTIFPSSLALIRKCHRKGIPVIITAHTIEEDVRDSFILSNSISWVIRKILIKLYNSADLVIAPTPYVKTLLENDRYKIRSPIEVLSNGVSIDRFKPDLKKESKRQIINYVQCKADNKEKIEQNSKIIMTVGLPIERKGLSWFCKVAKEMTDYKFVWFGDTSKYILPYNTRAKLRELKRLDNVYVVGYAPHNVLAKAYQCFDAFLLLTKSETESLAVLEAISSGMIAVLSDISTFKGWMEDGINCYIVKGIESSNCYGKNKSQNDKEIVENTIQLLTNIFDDKQEEKNKEMSKNARATACNRSLGIVGKKLSQIYRNCLNK